MLLTLARDRTSIRLIHELGRGGEGAVFVVEGRANQVAKVYSTAPDGPKVQKLVAMVGGATPGLLRIAAWPIDVLVDGKGAVQGFVMPRLTARHDIHELYSPKSRSEEFPETDFRFIVHVAANIARAFAVVHERGVVIGDVNHGNVLVGPDGTVMLIDCDSFQVRNGASVFTCDVGVPLFTAPELQGRPFRGLHRTANHDLFGLAVLLFLLLYMGRHPFAGRYLGSGDMPIEQAIAEYRFAYGPDRAASGMERPPGTIPLETMGSRVAQFFVEAFGRAGSGGSRPSAQTWIDALEGLKASLRVCATATWHHYPRQLASCPWCDLEAQTGVRLFGQRIAVVGPTGAIDLATLWKAIAAAPDPGPDPALPSERLWAPPTGVSMPSSDLKIARKLLTVGLVAIAFAACSLQPDTASGATFVLLVLALVAWPWVSPHRRAAADQAHSIAEAHWNEVLARWKREASRQVFAEKLMAMEKARAEAADLPNERKRRVAKLEAGREATQRHRYLDRFRIDRAKIRGIGSGRTAMLASYGIETADDIDAAKIFQIPGFGGALTGELLAWKQSHERNFRFNPSEPIDSRDIAALDHELEARKRDRLHLLRQGPPTLAHLAQEIVAARLRLMPILEESWTALKIEEARRRAL